MKDHLTEWRKMWRWAWWWAHPRRSGAPSPGPAEMPHPPYYGDRAQLPDRDYPTKAKP